MSTEDNSENEDSGEYEEIDEEDPNYGFGASSVEVPTFTSDDHKFSVYVGSSPTLPGILKFIGGLPVRKELKMSMVSTCSILLSPEFLLADNSPDKGGRFNRVSKIELAKIDAEKALRAMINQASKNDKRAFDIYGFIDLMNQLIGMYLTRTVGPERERMIMNEFKTTVTQWAGKRDHPSARTEMSPKRKDALSGLIKNFAKN
jgi:hypothetical protein